MTQSIFRSTTASTTPTLTRAADQQGSAAGQALSQVPLDAVQPHPLLRHGVAVPYRHRVVGERVEVNGHAERGTDLVLATVPAADRLRVVELHDPALAQPGGQVARLRRQVLVARQWQ